MSHMVDQNKLLLEIIKSGGGAKILPSNVGKLAYMINAPKPMPWNTKDKKNIETFTTEYEMYDNALRYIGGDIWVRRFGFFLNPLRMATSPQNIHRILSWRFSFIENLLNVQEGPNVAG